MSESNTVTCTAFLSIVSINEKEEETNLKVKQSVTFRYEDKTERRARQE